MNSQSLPAHSEAEREAFARYFAFLERHQEWLNKEMLDATAQIPAFAPIVAALSDADAGRLVERAGPGPRTPGHPSPGGRVLDRE